MTRLRKIASRYSVREDKLKTINEVFGVNHHIKKMIYQMTQQDVSY